MKIVIGGVSLSLTGVIVGCYANGISCFATPSPNQLLPRPVLVTSVKMQKLEGEYRLAYIKVNVTQPLEPLVRLSAALKQDRKANRFRVSWWLGALHINDLSTILYNRKNHTLFYYCRGIEGEDPPVKINAHYLYVGVTDTIIHQLANYAYTNAISGHTSAAGFDLLPRYGCQQNKLP